MVLAVTVIKMIHYTQALAGLLSWLKHDPVHPKVGDSIPSCGAFGGN